MWKNDRTTRYQGEEAEEEVGVPPQHVVCRTAQVSELLESGRGLVPVVDHIGHVPSQHEWNPVPAGKGSAVADLGGAMEPVLCTTLANYLLLQTIAM